MAIHSEVQTKSLPLAALERIKPTLAWQHPNGVISCGTTWLTAKIGTRSVIRLRGRDQLTGLQRAFTKVREGAAHSIDIDAETSEPGLYLRYDSNSDEVCFQIQGGKLPLKRTEARELGDWLETLFSDEPRHMLKGDTELIALTSHDGLLVLIFGKTFEEEKDTLLLSQDECSCLQTMLLSIIATPGDSTCHFSSQGRGMRISHGERIFISLTIGSHIVELTRQECALLVGQLQDEAANLWGKTGVTQ